jgi:hypothetical protein
VSSAIDTIMAEGKGTALSTNSQLFFVHFSRFCRATDVFHNHPHVSIRIDSYRTEYLLLQLAGLGQKLPEGKSLLCSVLELLEYSAR